VTSTIGIQGYYNSGVIILSRSLIRNSWYLNLFLQKSWYINLSLIILMSRVGNNMLKLNGYPKYKKNNRRREAKFKLRHGNMCSVRSY